MPNIDERAKAWEQEQAVRVGKAVAARRAELNKMTALELAARTKALGYPISRVAITKIENGTRAGKLDVAELVVLAEALEMAPMALMYAGAPDAQVEYLPGETVPTLDALRRFAGDLESVWPEIAALLRVVAGPAKVGRDRVYYGGDPRMGEKS
jgi:hypothetical protein